MKWEEVREQFPNSCVLVEAIKAETCGEQREIEELAVISHFKDGNDAWKAYKKIHAEDRSRELYIFHTNNADITVLD
ncbi:hypothetical protein ACUL41_00885 [Virgibacillus natechei]